MNINLSVCIIAKNEEKNLRQCLQRIATLQSEIVLVDTGSTDATLSIAAEYTDRLYTFPWKNDFAAAHNFAAAKASCNWILSIDCDEFLTEGNPTSLIDGIRRHPDSIGVITLLNPHVSSSGETQIVHMHVSRLYNRTLFHFQGKVHETLTPIVPMTEIHHFDAPLTFYHTGYLSEKVRRGKAKRDLQMLQTLLDEEGADPYTFFQIGKCHSALGNKALAVEYYDRGLSMNIDPRLAYVQDMIEAYGYALLDLKEYERALGLEAVYDNFAGHADFLFLMGLIYMNNARFDDAIAAFTKAMQTPVFSVEGVNDYRAKYNIGVIYEVQGDIAKAIEMYRSCGNYPPALARLEDLVH